MECCQVLCKTFACQYEKKIKLGRERKEGFGKYIDLRYSQYNYVAKNCKILLRSPQSYTAPYNVMSCNETTKLRLRICKEDTTKINEGQ